MIIAFGFLTRRFRDPMIPPALCDRVHRRMAQELKQLDAGTIWEIKPLQTSEFEEKNESRR